MLRPEECSFGSADRSTDISRNRYAKEDRFLSTSGNCFKQRVSRSCDNE